MGQFMFQLQEVSDWIARCVPAALKSFGRGKSQDEKRRGPKDNSILLYEYKFFEVRLDGEFLISLVNYCGQVLKKARDKSERTILIRLAAFLIRLMQLLLSTLWVPWLLCAWLHFLVTFFLRFFSRWVFDVSNAPDLFDSSIDEVAIAFSEGKRIEETAAELTLTSAFSASCKRWFSWCRSDSSADTPITPSPETNGDIDCFVQKVHDLLIGLKKKNLINTDTIEKIIFSLDEAEFRKEGTTENDFINKVIEGKGAEALDLILIANEIDLKPGDIKELDKEIQELIKEPQPGDIEKVNKEVQCSIEEPQALLQELSDIRSALEKEKLARVTEKKTADEAVEGLTKATEALTKQHTDALEKLRKEFNGQTDPAQLAELKDALSKMAAEATELKLAHAQEKEELSKQLEKARAERAAVEKEEDLWQAEKAAAAAESKAAHAVAEAAELKLAHALEKEELSKQLEEARAELAGAVEEKALWQGKLDQAEKSHKTALSKAVLNGENAVRDLQKEIEVHKKRTTKAENEAATHKAKLDPEAEKKAAEVLAKKDEQIKLLNGEIQQHRDLKDGIGKILVSVTPLSPEKKVEDLARQLALKNAEADRLKSQIEKLEKITQLPSDLPQKDLMEDMKAKAKEEAAAVFNRRIEELESQAQASIKRVIELEEDNRRKDEELKKQRHLEEKYKHDALLISTRAEEHSVKKRPVNTLVGELEAKLTKTTGKLSETEGTLAGSNKKVIEKDNTINRLVKRNNRLENQLEERSLGGLDTNSTSSLGSLKSAKNRGYKSPKSRNKSASAESDMDLETSDMEGSIDSNTST